MNSEARLPEFLSDAITLLPVPQFPHLQHEDNCGISLTEWLRMKGVNIQKMLKTLFCI